MAPRPMSEFEQAIEQAINRHSMEGGSNTPDFILAQYLGACLAAFNEAVTARGTWYGHGHTPISPLPATTNDQAMRDARTPNRLPYTMNVRCNDYRESDTAINFCANCDWPLSAHDPKQANP